MIRIQLEREGYVRWSTRERIAQLFARFPPEPRNIAIRNPLFLALALREKFLDMAEEIWALGLELCQFSEQVRVYPAPDIVAGTGDEKVVNVGDLCLAGPVRHAKGFLQRLLELGVRPISSNILLLAVPGDDPEPIRSDYESLRCLVNHGTIIHVEDDGKDRDGIRGLYPIVKWGYNHGVNAMRLAIRTSDSFVHRDHA
ncbi:hypothetical protein VTK26DRAFT_9306 [Humicola hyalothermophila]